MLYCIVIFCFIHKNKINPNSQISELTEITTKKTKQECKTSATARTFDKETNKMKEIITNTDNKN